MLRYIEICTDDQQEAFDIFRKKKKEDPKKNWAVADVRQMVDPPRTRFRWVVFYTQEN